MDKIQDPTTRNFRAVKKIADYYGYKQQAKKCIEEMAELTQAICKEDLGGMIEEMADVEITLAQIKYICKITEDELNNVKRFKIDRQIGRMEGENNG